MTTSTEFSQLNLNPSLLKAIHELGYEAPTRIQAEIIPLLLAGRDVVGQAQTGTGKTAAFALPLLDKLDSKQRHTQALILTPTRELSIQVSEALHSYSVHLPNVRVLPIYGGQPIQNQLAHLKNGTHIVVGTPGRLIDHLKRRTLILNKLNLIVLDEADEMLRMGFIEDVEYILSQAPQGLQIALFSATMPPAIRRIADKFLKNPATIHVGKQNLTVPTIEQSYVQVSESQKTDALTRILELEVKPGASTLIFTRTKINASELVQKLIARGYEAEAMHGDMSQAQREKALQRLRDGKLEVVVATDVAARGLDVENIRYVINYDAPEDTESYVHRIGRTGRAGKKGKAVLFITPRQQNLLASIERHIKQRIQPMQLPTYRELLEVRRTNLKADFLAALKQPNLAEYEEFLQQIATETGESWNRLAAAALGFTDQRLLKAVFTPEIESKDKFFTSNPTSRTNKKPRKEGEFSRSRSDKKDKDFERGRPEKKDNRYYALARKKAAGQPPKKRSKPRFKD